MFLILVFIFLFILLIGICFYYSYVLKRSILVFNIELTKNKKRLLLLLSIILSLLSINLFSFVGIFFMHFIVISLLIDVFYFLFKKVFKIEKNGALKKIYSICIIPFLITILVCGYGYFNIRNIVETGYTIYTDKNIGEDIRILLITDSHYGDILDKDSLDKVKNRLDEVKADIVVLGGDIVDEYTTKEEMEYIFKVFGNIENKDGIYYVSGNHDYQNYKLKPEYSNEELVKAISDNEITYLRDSYLSINDNVVIAGREDFSLGRKEVSNTLSGVNNSNYIIMIDHQPLDYEKEKDLGVDLILSGHTHGGQVFPVEYLIKLFHTADLSYGHKKIDGMDAIVSSGIAGWGYPIRTQKHSEYVVIDIKEK